MQILSELKYLCLIMLFSYGSGTGEFLFAAKSTLTL